MDGTEEHVDGEGAGVQAMQHTIVMIQVNVYLAKVLEECCSLDDHKALVQSTGSNSTLDSSFCWLYSIFCMFQTMGVSERRPRDACWAMPLLLKYMLHLACRSADKLSFCAVRHLTTTYTCVPHARQVLKLS